MSEVLHSTASTVRGSSGLRWLLVLGCSGTLLLNGCTVFRSDSGSSDPAPTRPAVATDNEAPTSLNADSEGRQPPPRPTQPSTSATPPPLPTAKQPLTVAEVNAAARDAAPTATQPNQPKPKQKSQGRTQEGPQDKGVAVDDEQVLKLAKQTEKAGAIARQNSGESTLSLLLINLQAEWLLQSKFAPSLEALPGKIPAETAEYRFKIASAATNEAIAVAEAKTKGLPSYVGAVYVGEADQLPVSAICKSNLPSQTAPETPQFASGQVVCAQGSTALEAE